MSKKFEGAPRSGAGRPTSHTPPRPAAAATPAGQRPRSEREAPSDSGQSAITDTAADIKDRASKLLERTKEAAQEIRDTAADAAHDWASGAQDAAASAVQRTQDAIAPVTEAVRRNIWPTVVIGAGLLWLVVENVRSERPRNSDVRHRGNDDGRTSRSVSNRASDASVQERLWQFVRENPLVAGATAIGAGLAISMALPETEPENEWLGGTRDTVVDRAVELARGTVDAVQGVAEGVQQLVGR